MEQGDLDFQSVSPGNYDPDTYDTLGDFLLSVPVLIGLLLMLLVWAISPRVGHRVAARLLYLSRPRDA